MHRTCYELLLLLLHFSNGPFTVCSLSANLRFLVVYAFDNRNYYSSKLPKIGYKYLQTVKAV